MSVLYQNKHGSKKTMGDQVDPLKSMITVRAVDAILLSKPMPSEGLPHLLVCLLEAVGAGAESEVMELLSDTPERLDADETFAAFPSLLCIAKDQLHVVLKIEQASGEKRTVFSSGLRCCLWKLRHGLEDNLPYYREGVPTMRTPALRSVMNDMTNTVARQRKLQIAAVGYGRTPYVTVMDFLKNVAALAKSYPDQMTRTVEKNLTVLGSLEISTAPKSLGYLMNGCRFQARHPEVPMLYGTTHNKAYHLEQKSFWRNVMIQTGRHARMIAKVATTTKLIGSVMVRATLVNQMRQTDLVRPFLQEYEARGIAFDQPLSRASTYNPPVRQPASAEARKRKRFRFVA